MTYTLRQRLGAIVLEVPRYLYHLSRKSVNGGPAWLQLRNRDQEIEISENPFGVKCEGPWTSELYLPKVFPLFTKKMLSKALTTTPFALSDKNTTISDRADVTFIIGHRGSARIELLLKTIDSIAAQKGCSVRCLVVEQDNTPIVRDMLPDWVDYIFTPLKTSTMAYSRSWTFNVGANHANSECLIFHDNDMLVPTCYAAEVLALFKQGSEFINLKRFIFYLSKEATAKLIKDDCIDKTLEIDSIVQNNLGGASIGASKKAFLSIGGFDERFIGWGGEDNEFWERALTRKVWSFTYLPLIHLWHAPQAEKIDFDASGTKTLYNTLSAQRPEDRIIALKNGVSTDTLVDP